jgi:hypothetical protein
MPVLCGDVIPGNPDVKGAALEEARKVQTAASKTFLRVQQQRTQRFNTAFEHIK